MTAMEQPKPFASLSSSLLARKGTARPAMRPQGFASSFGLEDDLGWNDMGAPGDQSVAEVTVPQVLVQREALNDEFGAPQPVIRAEAPSPERVFKSVSLATAARIGRETQAKHVANAKSAFTFRLDSDRHLKLRLASALHNQSAQLLVTEALDAFLANMPELDTLLSQLPARAKR